MQGTALLELLVENSVSEDSITDAMLVAMDYGAERVFDPDTSTVVKRSGRQFFEWALASDRVIYLHNPLDPISRDQIATQYDGEFDKFGYLPGKDLESSAFTSVESETSGQDEESYDASALSASETADAERELQAILDNGVKLMCSDIHLQPVSGKDVEINYRVDGKIGHPSRRGNNKGYLNLVNTIINRSGGQAGQYQKPFDGQFRHTMESRSVMCRVAIIAARVNGDDVPKVTIRLLGLDSSLRDLNRLGMPDTVENPQLPRMKAAFVRSNGLILVTGPTGSGKTTTLTAGLSECRRTRTESTIYTLEDPVESTLPGITQIQVNEKAGRTFSSGLRNLLRQDPDVILVGEIRDPETVSEALRASLTGHLVMSTLHSNSAVQTIPRILDLMRDMPSAASLLADAIVVISAQRTIPVICPSCSKQIRWGSLIDGSWAGFKGKAHLEVKYTDAPARYGDLKRAPTEDTLVRMKGPGCNKCSNSGIHKRHLVSEVLSFDRKLKDMVAEGASTNSMEQYAVEHLNFMVMWQQGIELVSTGVTSLELAEEALDVRGPPGGDIQLLKRREEVKKQKEGADASPQAETVAESAHV